MTDNEKNELLIRLATNMEELCRRMQGVESELSKRQCLLHDSQINTIEKTLAKDFDPMLCVIHTQDLKLIKWIGVVIGGGTMILLLKSFWHHIFPITNAVGKVAGI